ERPAGDLVGGELLGPGPGGEVADLPGDGPQPLAVGVVDDRDHEALEVHVDGDAEVHVVVHDQLGLAERAVHLGVLGDGVAAGAGAAAGASAAAGAAAAGWAPDSMTFSTSSRVMRPPRPVPSIVAGSRPCSLMRRRTTGDSSFPPASPLPLAASCLAAGA